MTGPAGVHEGDGLGSVGRQALRVFRAARRRRLATPDQQRSRLSAGLVAELLARGWDVPADLRPTDLTMGVADPLPGTDLAA